MAESRSAERGREKKEQEEEEDDDYMTMVIEDVPANKTETSLQRRERQRREGERRARVKSKAELAAEEEEARERALRTSMLDDPAVAKKSKGFAMMTKMGFTGGALGKKGDGNGQRRGEKDEDGVKRDDGGGARDDDLPRTEPIRVFVKEDRGGIGMESEKKRKLKEAAEAAEGQAKRAKADEGEYRDRVRREREVARLERQVHAAQKIAERMDEEVDPAEGEEGKGGDPEAERESGLAADGKRKPSSSRPLKSINVLWRGLVRSREEAERDRKMRRDLQQSLSRLPTYEDEHEDEDDRRALGKTETVYVTTEDLDEEDAELEDFNALEPEERLQRLVHHLRARYHYCFWCKFAYPDGGMEGCPGTTEEDHD